LSARFERIRARVFANAIVKDTSFKGPRTPEREDNDVEGVLEIEHKILMSERLLKVIGMYLTVLPK
jgi:hypothetical protein